jgi:hypothetical protein
MEVLQMLNAEGGMAAVFTGWKERTIYWTPAIGIFLSIYCLFLSSICIVCALRRVFVGESHQFSQLSLTRPGPASTVIPNVLFCGASSHPSGNGVPLVFLIGAKQVLAEKAARMLAKDN